MTRTLLDVAAVVALLALLAGGTALLGWMARPDQPRTLTTYKEMYPHGR